MMSRTLNKDISSDILYGCFVIIINVSSYECNQDVAYSQYGYFLWYIMHIDIRPCQTLLFFEHHSNYLWWLLRGFNFPLFATNRLIMNFYDRFALSKVFHWIDFLKKSVHSLSSKEAVVTRLSFDEEQN